METETATEPGYWFTHIGEIRYENQRSGHHWFDPSTLRYFGCRVGRTVYGGRYFVSSEQDNYDGGYNAWAGVRRYTVRMANADGTIETIGEFGEHDTREQAIAAIRRIMKQEGRS